MAAPVLAAQRRAKGNEVSVDSVRSQEDPTALTQVVPFDGGADEGAKKKYEAKQRAKSLCTRPAYGGFFPMLMDLVILVLSMTIPFRHSTEMLHLDSELRTMGASAFDKVSNAAHFYDWLEDYALDTSKLGIPTSGRQFGDPSFDFQSEMRFAVVGTLGRVTQLRRRQLGLCRRPAVLNSLESNTDVSDLLLMLGINCTSAYEKEMPFGHILNSNGTQGPKCPYSDFSYRTWGDTGNPQDMKTVKQDPWISQSSESLAKSVSPVEGEMRRLSAAYPGEFMAVEFSYGTQPSSEWIMAMKQCGWIDSRTLKVVVDTPIMSPTGMSMGITMHTFEFNEYGTVHTKRRDVKKFTLKKSLDMVEWFFFGWGFPSAETGRYLILYSNIILLCTKLFWTLAASFRDCYSCLDMKKAKLTTKRSNACSHGKQKLMRCFSLSHMADIYLLLTMVVMFICIRSYDASVEHIMDHFATMGAGVRKVNGNVRGNGIGAWSKAWSHGRIEVVSRINSARVQIEYYALSLRMFLLSMTMEMLRHFNSNRHFAIVPRSLAYAAKDIAFLAVVLSVLMIGYGGVLAFEFGGELPEFSSFSLTMRTVTTMTLGDWGGHVSAVLDRSKNPAVTFVLFVVYNVIVIIVTMNVFLSIVLDAYTVIKDYQEKNKNANELLQNSSVNELLTKLRAYRSNALYTKQ